MSAEASSKGEAAVAFGRYRLLAKLGKGGMGEVFLAMSKGAMGFNKLVVVKRLTIPDEASEEDIERGKRMFVDEARLAARLNHPHVVQTNDVGIENGAHYLTMEYLEGQTLAALLRTLAKKKQKLGPELAARIVLDTLSGLQYAHELEDFDGKPLGIVHRDLSPHNVFITYDGVIKLLDFGVAKASINAQKTEAGILKGKFAYMAPEQLTGDVIDQRADIFVIGILLWELLTDQRLMVKESDAQTVRQLLSQPIPALKDVDKDISPELNAIVMKALERDANARWKTAREMRVALEAAVQSKIATTDALGGLMTQHFSARRDEVKALVQAVVARADSLAPPPMTAELPMLRPPSSQASGEETITPASGRAAGSTVTPAAAVSDTIVSGSASASFAKKQKQRTGLIAIAGVLVLGAILAIAFRSKKGEDTEAHAAPSASTTSSTAVSSAAATETKATASAAAANSAPATPDSAASAASSAKTAATTAAVPKGRPGTWPPPRTTPVTTAAVTHAPPAPAPAPTPEASSGRRIFNTKLE